MSSGSVQGSTTPKAEPGVPGARVPNSTRGCSIPGSVIGDASSVAASSISTDPVANEIASAFELAGARAITDAIAGAVAIAAATGSGGCIVDLTTMPGGATGMAFTTTSGIMIGVGVGGGGIPNGIVGGGGGRHIGWTTITKFCGGS